jgi:hypothetical protein
MPTIDVNDGVELPTALAGLTRINAQTGTTYTLQLSDRDKDVVLTNAAAITLGLPNSLPEGWGCGIIQGGAGQVTLNPAPGATLGNYDNHTKLAGLNATAGLVVRSNVGGASAAYVLSGTTSA